MNRASRVMRNLADSAGDCRGFKLPRVDCSTDSRLGLALPDVVVLILVGQQAMLALFLKDIGEPWIVVPIDEGNE